MRATVLVVVLAGALAVLAGAVIADRVLTRRAAASQGAPAIAK